MKAEDCKQLYRHNLSAFTQFGFNILNPYEQYLHNYHIDLITDHLAKVESGEILRLIINLPPRMLKSHCASICFPAWLLGRDPRKKVLCVTGSQDLTKEHEASFLELVNSPRYKSIFSNNKFINQGNKIQTLYGGFRKSVCMEAQVTGTGADIIVVDDPISAHKAQDDVTRNNVNQQFDLNYLQRLNNKKEGAIIVVMQRLHEHDLTGHILKNNNDWVCLDLSALAPHDEQYELASGRIITRKKFEPLHPERESFEDLLRIRRNIGAEAFSAQYLQYQLKVSYAAVVQPRKYRTIEEWKRLDPAGYFAEYFLRDAPACVVPERGVRGILPTQDMNIMRA